MKKRLRKKLGVKEFRELHFTVSCKVAEMDEAAEDALFDKIIDIVENHEMHCGGYFDTGVLELEICTGYVDTDNQSRYEAAKTELSALEGLSEVEISDLF